MFKNRYSSHRRRFLKVGVGVSTTVATGLHAPWVIGQAKPRLVVVGGGAGGATVARYVAKSGNVDVTLIEANPQYTSCFFSNLYLGDFRDFDSITHDYEKLTDAGVNVVHAMATGIDADAKKVVTDAGDELEFDRLVVAPGIDFKMDAIEGYDEKAAIAMPHAYKPGEQTRLLKEKIDSFENGGVFLVAAPPNPFRCPPGPYERASMIAHVFSQSKPDSKILIVDTKESHSKQSLFQAAWERFYPGMIEWLPADMTGGGVTGVDATTMTVRTEDENFEVAAANIIPPQTAGKIAIDAGLADDSGWCPVDSATLESKLLPAVHVVGDAIIPGDMPKSGFSANSQAKVCANAVLAELTDSKIFPAKFRNTCWSLVTTDHGIKVGANYEATDEKISKLDGFLSEIDEDDETRKATAIEANGWYDGIITDMFG